jgi:hypothetical protein
MKVCIGLLLSVSILLRYDASGLADELTGKK